MSRAVAGVFALAFLLAGCDDYDLGGFRCPLGAAPCGNGCRPVDSICCFTSKHRTSSYCPLWTNGCYPNNEERACRSLATGERAEFCCGNMGIIGSHDCPQDHHHCGSVCRPADEPCCPEETTDQECPTARSSQGCPRDQAMCGYCIATATCRMCNRGGCCAGDPCAEKSRCVGVEGSVCGPIRFEPEEECTPDCTGRVCGPDGCGGTCRPGCTGLTEYCTGAGQCEDDCAGMQCGISPIAGYDCGSCPGGQVCFVGACCAPDCAPGAPCDQPDGCGRACGCPNEQVCVSGSCLDAWIAIQGGSFMMGSDSGYDNEAPVHQVVVAWFEMYRSEVTVGQYRACVNAGTCTAPLDASDYPVCNWGQPARDHHPVTCLDWNQASAYCAWLGGRLPSEAEWEYAARGGGREVTYPWGDDAPSCSYAVMDYGGAGCGEDRTWAVCSLPAGNTAHGLCDMAGNVWEWVQDGYHPNYIGAPSDGSAWEEPDDTQRVMRGGDYGNTAYDLRITVRIYGDPGDLYAGVGFRCVR